MTRLPIAPDAVADVAATAGVAPLTLVDMLRVVNTPGFDRWREQIRRTGGCSDPVHLQGWTITK
ncbi:replication initiation protein, partial [Streptomyces sp. NPDC056121]